MTRRTRRFVLFTIAILIGIAAGIAFGWIISPVQYTDTGPHTLRIDYKTDFVLMVAEIHHADGDVAAAISRLRFLGETPPSQLVEESLQYGEVNNYAPEDLQKMTALASAIEFIRPASE